MDGNGTLSQSSKTNEELALEIQELRQCLIAICNPGIGPFWGNTESANYWWEKLTEYPDVRNG